MCKSRIYSCCYTRKWTTHSYIVSLGLGLGWAYGQWALVSSRSWMDAQEKTVYSINYTLLWTAPSEDAALCLWTANSIVCSNTCVKFHKPYIKIKMWGNRFTSNTVRNFAEIHLTMNKKYCMRKMDPELCHTQIGVYDIVICFCYQ